MTGEANTERRGWGLPASVGVHVLVALLVIFGLPITLPKPPEEEAVSVTIEPPPKPAEPAKAPPPTESAKPPAPQQAAAPIPMLNPVVKFAEKDAGPRQSLAGGGAEDKPAEPTRPADEPEAADTAPKTPDASEKPPAETESAESEEPADSKAEEADGAGSVPLIAATTEAPDKAAPPSKQVAPKPAAPKQAKNEEKLHEARTLFSRSANSGATATTAMAGIPRGVRAGRLCATELRLQLVNGAPPYFPDLLPSYELKEGTILKVRRSAFRVRGAWRNLSFECQVDANATSVVSFAFDVGEPLSPDEARRRGLPSL